jgi:hypothetical protein
MVRPTLADKLVVAISSRALFDLTDSHRVYTEAGVDAYHRYQIEREDEILAPGPAFVLVKKLLRLNRPDKQYVEVILLSRNSADTGLRVFNAIKHYALDITRAAFKYLAQVHWNFHTLSTGLRLSQNSRTLGGSYTVETFGHRAKSAGSFHRGQKGQLYFRRPLALQPEPEPPTIMMQQNIKGLGAARLAAIRHRQEHQPGNTMQP